MWYVGLEYLYCGGDLKIIYRNVKSLNILLGFNYVLKVFDFGFLKLVVYVEKMDILIFVRGIVGYFDFE